MIIYENIRKVKRQILGEENMFGYKTTIVNQLCLMYYVYGKIFNMDRHTNWFLKSFYLSWHYSGLVCAYISGLLFLQYGNKKDFIMLLYVWFAVCLCTFMSILIPLTSYWYTANIEAMLARMDDVLSKRASSVASIDMKNLITNDLLFILVSGSVYNLVCSFDVIVFYEEEKLINYMYYSFPLPCLEKYGSLKLYITSTLIVNMAVLLPIVEIWAVLKFFEIWAAVCYHEVMFICKGLEKQSKNVIMKTKDFSEYHNDEEITILIVRLNTKFKMDLLKCIMAFQDVTCLIEMLKKHYESICSLMLVGSFICQLTHAYICLATDLALSVKCKELALFLFTAVLTFIVCRVGEILEDVTTTMSLEVYSTPWYLLLPPFRRDIPIMIGQTQKRVNPMAMKVYPIDVNLFQRLMNSIFSTTNVLARLMRK